MPRYRVRVEYALAFDIDLEVEARSRPAAIARGWAATNNADLSEAIRGQFPDLRAEFSSGNIEVTDVRVVHTIRRGMGLGA